MWVPTCGLIHGSKCHCERVKRKGKVLPSEAGANQKHHREKENTNRRAAMKRRLRIDTLPRKGEHESMRHCNGTQMNANRVGRKAPSRVDTTQENWLPWKAHSLRIFTWPHQTSQKTAPPATINHAPWPIHLSSYRTFEPFCSHFEAHIKDAVLSWEM